MTSSGSAASAAQRPRLRFAFVTFLLVVGWCEVLATSHNLDLDVLPAWLSGAIAMVGFLTFLLLAGMFGNPVLAIALVFLAWRGWRWPLGGALLLSLPFWIVTVRVLPNPWS